MTENRPFSHIKHVIETKNKVAKPVALIKRIAAGIAAVVGGSGSTGKAAESAGGRSSVGFRGAASGTRGSAASTSSSAPGGAHVSAASSSSSAPSAVLSNKGVGARGLADVSTSDDVEGALEALFEQNSPEFHLGDCRDVIRQHSEWESKITLLLLDPPFGILEEPHDKQLLAEELLWMCNYLLKEQGMNM